METEMLTKKQASVLRDVFPIVLGSLVLAGLSQIEVRIGLVPVTLQSLGVFLLALFQGKWKATLSICLYLVEASLGFPVLAGGRMNPLWILGPSGGYLIAFPFAAYLMGRLLEVKEPVPFSWRVLSLAVGQILIFTLGVGFLVFKVGFSQALVIGFFPFLWIELLKNLCAASFKGCFEHLKGRVL